VKSSDISSKQSSNFQAFDNSPDYVITNEQTRATIRGYIYVSLAM